MIACLAVGCGFRVEPAQLGDAAVPDGEADARVEGPDAALPCFGVPGGLVRVCLTTPAPPRFEVGTTTVLDTDAPSCAVVTGAGTDGACVIVAQQIQISQRLTATGSRPLVLVADEITVTATGVLDLASRRDETPGAGANAAACGASGNVGTGGGGPGGSFTGRGGGGGGSSGGSSALATPTPTTLRGGCPGTKGFGAISGGAGGPGGGAVYLIASTTITVAGTINASGAGGTGGGPSANGGGGGGGSGGMIVLDAPAIAITGAVFANGAGGGEGADGPRGMPGQDPPDATTLPRGGLGGNTNGGEGGDGTVGATRTGDAGGGPYGFFADEGGGGGGGGAGYIQLLGVRSGAGPISPPPS